MTTDLYLGIDPSERHTGLALWTGVSGEIPTFHEIKPANVDLLSAVRNLRIQFRSWLRENVGKGVRIGMEKQAVSGHSAILLFYVQMVVLEEISDYLSPTLPKMIHPIPIQLRSYMKKKHGVGIRSKTEIVSSFKKKYGERYKVRRISSHCVEAYYLARMTEDVFKGDWSYTPLSYETILTPWTSITGRETCQLTNSIK